MRDTLQRGQRDVLFPALDRRVVSPMHMDPVREVVLAEPGNSALSAQRLTKLDRQGGRFRHADTLGRRYFPLYHLIDRLLISITADNPCASDP